MQYASAVWLVNASPRRRAPEKSLLSGVIVCVIRF